VTPSAWPATGFELQAPHHPVRQRGECHGHLAHQSRGPRDDGAGGDRPPDLDDRAAGDDAVFLDAELHALQSALPALRRLRELQLLPLRPDLSRRPRQHAGAGARGSRHHGGRWHPGRPAARPRRLRGEFRPASGDRAVLRHADRGGAGLEEHDDEPGLRGDRPVPDRPRLHADRLDDRRAASVDHHHRRLAVAALRHADPPDRPAVPVDRPEGGGRDGRGGGAVDLLLHHPAAYEPGDHRGDPHPDDLPPVDLCRDPGDDAGRAGIAIDQHHLSRGAAGDLLRRYRRGLGRRHRGGDPCQYRRDLPRPPDRQESRRRRRAARCHVA